MTRRARMIFATDPALGYLASSAANQTSHLHRVRVDDPLRGDIRGDQVDERKHGPEVHLAVLGVAGHGPDDRKDPTLAAQGPLLLGDQSQVHQGPAGHGLDLAVGLVPFHAREHCLHAVPRGSKSPQTAVAGGRAGKHHPLYAPNGPSSQNEKAEDFLPGRIDAPLHEDVAYSKVFGFSAPCGDTMGAGRALATHKMN